MREVRYLYDVTNAIDIKVKIPRHVVWSIRLLRPKLF